MLEHWKFEIMNSFLIVDGIIMSYGSMESLNGRLKRVLHDGYGYSNFYKFRNRIMFCKNKNESINFKN